MKQYRTKRISKLDEFRLELMEINSDCVKVMPIKGLILQLTDLRTKNDLKVEYRFNGAQLAYLNKMNFIKKN